MLMFADDTVQQGCTAAMWADNKNGRSIAGGYAHNGYSSVSELLLAGVSSGVIVRQQAFTCFEHLFNSNALHAGAVITWLQIAGNAIKRLIAHNAAALIMRRNKSRV